MSDFPGRKLDAAVAQHIFGYGVRKQQYPMGSRGEGVDADGGPWTPMFRDEWELLDNGAPIIVMYELGHGSGPLPVPHYSTDISAAWVVVEKLTTLYEDCQFTLKYRIGYAPDFWLAGWQVYRNGEGWEWSDVLGCSEGDTAPLAICRVALQALTAPDSPADSPSQSPP